jgi:hypothetical protein
LNKKLEISLIIQSRVNPPNQTTNPTITISKIQAHELSLFKIHHQTQKRRFIHPKSLLHHELSNTTPLPLKNTKLSRNRVNVGWEKADAANLNRAS